jgi:hypothetical protein
MTTTNKRYSYLRVTVIRINVHPTRKNLINTPHTFHARSVYGPQPYISRGPCRQPFASPHEDETNPYTRKKSWQPKINWPGYHLGSPYSLSLITALEVREVLAKWLHSHINLLSPYTSKRLVRSILAHSDQLIGP